MKIDGLKGISGSRIQESRAKKSAPSDGEGHKTVDDSVDLTSTAARLQQLEGMLGNVEVFDAAKVESVRQAIANGTFQVNADAIAEGLVNSIVEGLRQRNR